MICNIILSKEDNRYLARVREWPEVTAQEQTREKAIDSVKTRLTQHLEQVVEIVQIEAPFQPPDGNPWLDTFGMFRDDPTFEDLKAEISACRQKADHDRNMASE